MMPGQGRDRANAEPAAAGSPPDQARAETYLRLRAEAELRRVLALPRDDPPSDRGMPVPLRTAAGLVLPLGRRAADVLQPLADSAARTVHPLAESAARTLQPLSDNAQRALRPLAGQAARTLQPLAGNAARALQPLADQAIRTMLPLANEAERRLNALAVHARYRLQVLRYTGSSALLRRWRPDQATAVRRARADAPHERREPSADEGLHRLRTVADGLAYAGAIDSGTAESVLTGLETAVMARSRIDAYRVVMFNLHARHHRQQAHAAAGPYLAAPVGVTVPPGPDSGLAEVRLFTLVIAPDRAVLTLAGRLSEPHGTAQHQDPWPAFGGPQHPSATDDRGNSYRLHDDSGWSDGDGDWRAIMRISPVPPAGIQWLELAMSPGSPAIRVDLAGSGGDGGGTSGPIPHGSPAEGLIDAAAVDLLHLAVLDDDGNLPWHDLSGTADIVTALDAVGALAPARGAVGRLITLARRLGVNVPAALSAAAQPGDLPDAWADVLENRHRRDGPRGVAAAAAVLPELDGARFVLAGLRSDPAGAELHALGWGWQHVPHLFQGAVDNPWSWSARDDQGRWHVATERASSSSDNHTDLQLRLVPPLHPDATSLEVTLAGPAGQVTATVPLDWQEQA